MYYLESFDTNINSFTLTKCYSHALFHSIIENDSKSMLTDSEKEQINTTMIDHGQCSYYLSESDQTIRLINENLIKFD